MHTTDAPLAVLLVANFGGTTRALIFSVLHVHAKRKEKSMMSTTLECARRLEEKLIRLVGMFRQYLLRMVKCTGDTHQYRKLAWIGGIDFPPDPKIGDRLKDWLHEQYRIPTRVSDFL